MSRPRSLSLSSRRERRSRKEPEQFVKTSTPSRQHPQRDLIPHVPPPVSFAGVRMTLILLRFGGLHLRNWTEVWSHLAMDYGITRAPLMLFYGLENDQDTSLSKVDHLKKKLENSSCNRDLEFQTNSKQIKVEAARQFEYGWVQGQQLLEHRFMVGPDDYDDELGFELADYELFEAMQPDDRPLTNYRHIAICFSNFSWVRGFFLARWDRYFWCGS
ncbi:hypothetical protein GBA52_020129 [Prunus armeniaca]|nr:hypothetical protein GBA52_020129 [Prunus armeniaca]